MAITITTCRVGKGSFEARVGDLVVYGKSAAEARAEAERRVMASLEFVRPVVEAAGSVTMVAWSSMGAFGYDVFDAVTGARRVSVSTGESFAEAVEAMRRHASQYRADAAA